MTITIAESIPTFIPSTETSLNVPRVERSLEPLRTFLPPGAEIKPEEVTTCMLELLQPLIDGAREWVTHADAATGNGLWGTILAIIAGMAAWAGLKSRG